MNSNLKKWVVEKRKIRKKYWYYHPESDCLFISTKENMPMCEEIEICEVITGDKQEALDAIKKEYEYSKSR